MITSKSPFSAGLLDVRCPAFPAPSHSHVAQAPARNPLHEMSLGCSVRPRGTLPDQAILTGQNVFRLATAQTLDAQARVSTVHLPQALQHTAPCCRFLVDNRPYHVPSGASCTEMKMQLVPSRIAAHKIIRRYIAPVTNTGPISRLHLYFVQRSLGLFV